MAGRRATSPGHKARAGAIGTGSIALATSGLPVGWRRLSFRRAFTLTLLRFPEELSDPSLRLRRWKRRQEQPEERKPLVELDLAVAVAVELLKKRRALVLRELRVEDEPDLHSERRKPRRFVLLQRRSIRRLW